MTPREGAIGRRERAHRRLLPPFLVKFSQKKKKRVEVLERERGKEGGEEGGSPRTFNSFHLMPR